MRINKYLALVSNLSRRSADQAIEQGRVAVNGQPAAKGQEVSENSQVTLDGQLLQAIVQIQTIMLNKPVGYVVSRNGQGNRTIYDLLPKELHHLRPVGRLDKDSSGLLLLTNDGALANQLTHPSYQKNKVYEVTLNKPLSLAHQQQISRSSVQLEDGPSTLQLDSTDKTGREWRITMQEGRNRQIRRTLKALGYTVRVLHRIRFGPYSLGDMEPGKYRTATTQR